MKMQTDLILREYDNSKIEIDRLIKNNEQLKDKL